MGADASDPRTSGDLLADRRYGYAEAAFDDGDWEAAADVARQVVAIAPRFAAASLLLGRSCEALARAAADPMAAAHRQEAVAAFRAALAADPADRLGAALHLARLGEAAAADAMSPGYVTALFDEYATRFDRHLRTSLRYRAPELLHDAVRRTCSRLLRDPAFGRTLDLGCGTGLAGELFRPWCGVLVGVDLSPGMLRRAAAKRLYDELVEDDLVAWLDREPSGSADLVLAADVMVYLGDLHRPFRAVARVLAGDGLFGFTVQEGGDGAPVVLGEDHRFAHAESHLVACADAAGLAVMLSEPVSSRQDRGVDVPGRLMVLRKPGRRDGSA